MAHDTVYACVRDKAESIGQLPVRLKRKTGDTYEKVTQGREFRIFTQRPNDFQTMQDFIEMYVATLELRGNFYAYVSRNKYGNVAEILPFRNQAGVSVNMDASGRVYYMYATNDGKPDMTFAGADILHVKNFTLDGFTGASAIAYGARSIGIGIAQEDYLSNIMADGFLAKGVLTTEQAFKGVEGLNRLKSDWKKFTGTNAQSEIPILEQGLKYQALNISPADAELISQRGFSREQICGILRVPPRRIGITASAKGAGSDIEQENKDYYQNKLVPIITKLEHAINFVLPDNLSISLDEKGFIRGDFESQVKGAHEAVKSGLASLNEGREIIDMQPVDGGDVHAIDTNNLTFGVLTD
ncbi:MAG: phage portal protein, partial [Glaciecola sp.]